MEYGGRNEFLSEVAAATLLLHGQNQVLRLQVAQAAHLGDERRTIFLNFHFYFCSSLAYFD